MFEIMESGRTAFQLVAHLPVAARLEREPVIASELSWVARMVPCTDTYQGAHTVGISEPL